MRYTQKLFFVWLYKPYRIWRDSVLWFYVTWRVLLSLIIDRKVKGLLLVFRNLIPLNFLSCRIQYPSFLSISSFMRNALIMIWIHACIKRAFDMLWQLFHDSLSLTMLSLSLSLSLFFHVNLKERERERDQTLERNINLIESAHPSPPGERDLQSLVCVCILRSHRNVCVKRSSGSFRKKQKTKDSELRLKEEMVECFVTVHHRTEKKSDKRVIYLTFSLILKFINFCICILHFSALLEI